MLTGEFNNTLDEKGRLNFPAKFRDELAVDRLVVTKGMDKCLWAFHPTKWAEVKRNIMANTSPFHAAARRVQRTIVSPAQEVEIDKTGRIAIPQSLREYASLTKDCVVAGVDTYFEIWDKDTYAAYCEDGADEFSAAAEELGVVI
jgi:MraZ protein